MKKALLILLSICAILSSCKNTPEVPADSATQEGSKPPASPPVGQAYDLVITEVMPDNRDLLLGSDVDWVEIYNREEIAVALDGYSLTDSLEKASDLPLDGMQIPAGGYLVVKLDASAAFHLSSQGETVYLTQQGYEVSRLTYGAVQNGESFSPEGACRWATPGFANTEEGYLAYLDTLDLPDLIISEAMSSNLSYLPQNGKYYDLIEIRNISDQPIGLSEYSLSDKGTDKGRYIFPDVTLGAGECFVVFCSGEPSLGDRHASFKLGSSGETVYLSRNGSVVDTLKLPSDLRPDESFGREGNRPVYLLSPTFGKENGGGHLTGLARPAASLPSGLYGESVTVELSGAGTVYYTLDGSRPTVNSPVYREPLTVSGVTTVRAFCVDGERSSAPVAYTYLVGVQHDLPVVTVAIPRDLLNGTKGVLNHIDQNYEYEAVLTLIEEGKEQFSVPFGFRLHGNDSRKGKKQNFQLRFRSEYGAGKLNYPLFDDRDLDEYDSLLLKGGSEDWNSSIMRDEVCTAIVNGTTALYTQAIKPCVLYLGGEYWGIYYLRERFDEEYVANHLDVSADSVDLLEANGSVENGSAKEYEALLSYVKTHDMTKAEHYAYLCEKVDVTSLMDWYICRSYMGDKDLANVRYFRTPEADGKWRWMFYDLDWALLHTNDSPISTTMPDNGKHVLIRAALKSKEGKDAFLKRYAELMDTVLNETYIIGVIDSIANAIESEVERDRAKWGYSVSAWENAVERLRAYVRDGARDKTVLADIKDYFDLTDQEMNAYFG